MSSLISNDVQVSPIEYVTKFSINRNFLKLCMNDEAMQKEIIGHLDRGQIHSYIPMRTYAEGECVFYKSSESSQSLYLLCSEIDDNVFDPFVYENSIGELVVSSDENWKIVGLPEKVNRNPKDYALEYVLSNENDFLSSHQNNTQLSAHPTKELGINKSSIVFTSLENIEEERETFFYPNELATVNPDNSIIAGYMRKWDNGILEYDILFRLGYQGEVNDQGLSVISANNLDVYHRNYNNLYFKDDADFQIFNQGEGYFVAVNKTKQVNLNLDLNAYYGEVKFPEPFKDLNYMVFTSNMKNVDVECYNMKNEVLKKKEYDDRILVDGLALTGHVEDADWTKELVIPSQLKNIGKEALAYIKSTIEGDELSVTILSDAQIVNIEDYAFAGSDIFKIVVPKNVKCIGQYAFTNCEHLETVDFYVNEDVEKQPIVDFNLFVGCDKLEKINIHYYKTPILFGAASSEQRAKAYAHSLDIAQKFNDLDLRDLYGIKKSVEIVIDGKTIASTAFSHAEVAMPLLAASNNPSNEDLDDEKNYVTLTIEEFFGKMKEMQQPKVATLMNAASMLASATAVQDEISISCNDEAQLCIIRDEIKSMNVVGSADMNCQLSGKQLEQLTLSGFSSLCSNMLSIQSVQSMSIVPSESGIEYNQGSLASLSINSLEIDMTNSFIGASAFMNSQIDSLLLKNFDDAFVKDEVQRKGIGKDAFICSKVASISIDSSLDGSILKKELSSMLITEDDANVAAIPDNCIINDGLMFASRSLLAAAPESKYLCIDLVDSMYTVISCNWKELCADGIIPYEPTEEDEISVDVPSGIERIGVSAFNRGMKEANIQLMIDDKLTKLDFSPFQKISLPNTVKQIDQLAFASNTELISVDFEEGTDLSVIASPIFDADNESLEAFIIH